MVADQVKVSWDAGQMLADCRMLNISANAGIRGNGFADKLARDAAVQGNFVDGDDVESESLHYLTSNTDSRTN